MALGDRFGSTRSAWWRCRWRPETTLRTTRGSCCSPTAPSRCPPKVRTASRGCRRRSTSTAGTATSCVVFAVPDKFVPEPTGPATHGARGNAGFEGLTLSPDGERLFTATETALIQDGATATFDAGAQTRIIEYVPRRGTFEPAREFVYGLEPVQKPPFIASPRFFINGLVELLAINRTTLLALERGYVENEANAAQSRNRIRLYRVSLTGATDVSPLESLKGHPEIVPVTKTLLLDLSDVQGLSRELAPSLDNFEGMAFGPRLPDGRASLIIVSDDNFSQLQRTWFLLFAIQ